jgi:hypothetical protein
MSARDREWFPHLDPMAQIWANEPVVGEPRGETLPWETSSAGYVVLVLAFVVLALGGLLFG